MMGHNVAAAMNPVVEGVYNGQRAGAPFAAAAVLAPALMIAGPFLGQLARVGWQALSKTFFANAGLVTGGIK